MRCASSRSKVLIAGLGLALTVALGSATANGYGDPPPNDNLADAQLVTGLPVTVKGTLSGSTAEDGSPYPMKGVWYRWTAPRAIAPRIVFQGRGDVALFEGTPDNLTEIPLNAVRVRYNIDYYQTSQTLTAGAEYFIAVGDGSSHFRITLDSLIPGGKVLARHARSPFNLRIPIKLDADVPATVRLTGEIYVRPHQRKLSQRRKLVGQTVDVGHGGPASVTMRIPAKNRERSCETLLYALSLRDVRIHRASGTATFTTDAGDRNAIPWEVDLDRLESSDRPKIRDGAGLC